MDEAIAAFQRGDYKTAFAEIQQPAMQGNAKLNMRLDFTITRVLALIRTLFRQHFGTENQLSKGMCQHKLIWHRFTPTALA